MPQWFVNIQRESLWVIRHYSWSKLYLKDFKIKKAYITFNGSVELGFMKGLKNANFNYIEHGYPIEIFFNLQSVVC